MPALRSSMTGLAVVYTHLYISLCFALTDSFIKTFIGALIA
jgi:hypothetical protein